MLSNVLLKSSIFAYGPRDPKGVELDVLINGVNTALAWTLLFIKNECV